VFASLLALFTILTFLETEGYKSSDGVHPLQATAGTITGPFTGAIARGYQSCCLKVSVTLTAYCAPILLFGVFVQFIRLPEGRLSRTLRMVLWVVGWLVWFLGGILALGHAMF